MFQRPIQIGQWYARFDGCDRGIVVDFDSAHVTRKIDNDAWPQRFPRNATAGSARMQRKIVFASVLDGRDDIAHRSRANDSDGRDLKNAGVGRVHLYRHGVAQDIAAHDASQIILNPLPINFHA